MIYSLGHVCRTYLRCRRRGNALDPHPSSLRHSAGDHAAAAVEAERLELRAPRQRRDLERARALETGGDAAWPVRFGDNSRKEPRRL